MQRSDSSFTPRTQTTVTCSRCKQPATVPFTPTPGRPVYCRACFSRAPAAQTTRSAPNKSVLPPRRRMLSQRKKGHFVYDALEALGERETWDDSEKRTFVEMVFARGSRQGTGAAIEFLSEKRQDETITPQEAARLADLVETYSLRR